MTYARHALFVAPTDSAIAPRSSVLNPSASGAGIGEVDEQRLQLVPEISADSPLIQPIQPDGLWLTLTSYARLTVGALVMWAGVVLFVLLLIPALPWRTVRIRMSNIFGTLFGGFMFWCSGSKLTVHGYKEAVARGPAIWAMNHNSLLDIPLGIWFAPSGSVGVGKKQVLLYPFFGQLYVLAGHLRIDRSQAKSAVKSMRRMGEWVREKKLSIFIWPEGTRSKAGRLQAMKKGVVHLAIQTGLPIQPMVTAGTQHSWPKGPPKVRPTNVTINFPEPIVTTGWKVETIEEHLAELEGVFIDVLPPAQRPLKPLR